MTCYFVVPLTTRLVRTILFVLFSSFPSNLSVRMLKAFFPTSSPCCSTVVSFGSVLWAMAPSVKPQMETSSGTLSPTSLQAYKIPAAVSSLIAKKPSGRLSLSNKSGVMAMARSRLSHSLIMLSFTGILYFFMASRYPLRRFLVISRCGSAP